MIEIGMIALAKTMKFPNQIATVFESVIRQRTKPL
jgi:hypothetical protein